MRQRIQAPEQVRALTGIGGDRRLGLHVVERFIGDVDLDAGRLGEVGDQLHESVLLGLDEVLPAQQRELGVALRLPWRRLGPGASTIRSSPEPASAPVAANAVPPLHEGAAGQRGHGRFLRCMVSGIHSLSGWLVEQMHEPRIGLEPDLVARLELMALAEHGDDVRAADLGDHLQLGSGRLDDLDSASTPSSAIAKCSGRMP